MRIFIAASKHCYHRIPPIAETLAARGHDIVFPNAYDDPFGETTLATEDPERYLAWKHELLRKTEQDMASVDAVLVVNTEKHGIPNYIGGATFIEVYEAFRQGKRIFFWNPLPEGMLHDELHGMAPVILHQDLSRLT